MDRSSSPEQCNTGGLTLSETMRRKVLELAGVCINIGCVRLYTRHMPTVEEVEEALTNVIDPELGLDFVELGLIYGITVEGGDVHVTYTLTTPACPIGPMVAQQIEEFVTELDGVDSVESAMVFTPPWSPDKMSEDAKFALGY